MLKKLSLLIFLSFFFQACGEGLDDVLEFPFPENEEENEEEDEEREQSDQTGLLIRGTPTAASLDIYSNFFLNELCKSDECEASYEKLPPNFYFFGNQEDSCHFDYDPTVSNQFLVKQADGPLNGFVLDLSKEDLFFLAWVSMRYEINPHFLMGILSQESRGNCAAVSPATGQGCFQLTYRFAKPQLEQSYPDRVANWHWTNRVGYYPENIYVDEESYFGRDPLGRNQNRMTLDPTEFIINGVQVSSVANFHYGIIASALYFHWQQYLLYYRFDSLHDISEELFQTDEGKASWQAAAYNGGAFRARLELRDHGLDFLDHMAGETRNYVPAVLDYCHGYQEGELFYNESYTQEDVAWLIELLSDTYIGIDIDWEAVQEDVDQVFFSEDDATLTLVDDIKALIYVISTSIPSLAPEWPSEGSI